MVVEVAFAADVREGSLGPPRDDAVDRLVLRANARIDNRVELVAALGGDRPVGRPDDGQLILASYRRWGQACPERLIGDFAFSVWDPVRGTLFGARDPFGVKPFYYHHSDAGFAWSSDVAELLDLSYVPRRLNPFGVADHLMAFPRDRSSTVHDAVRRLPPAHVLTVDATGLRTRSYWKPDARRELRLGSDAEYDEAFLESFRRAVGDRLAGGGRVGSALSGGLDSSSVTAVAQLLSEVPIHAVTGVFDSAPESDERRYARAVVAHTGVHGHECPVDAHSPFADWEGAPWREAQPGINPQIALARAYGEGARRAGVDVLLSGLGGDEVASHGRLYLTELAAAGRLRRFHDQARAVARGTGRPLRPVIRTALSPLVPEAARRAKAIVRGRGPVWPIQNPIRREVVLRLGLEVRASDLLAGVPRPRTQRQAQAQSVTSGQLARAMETSYATAAVLGLDRRNPFYDRRLVELCLSLPADQKLRDGWGRLILRRALAGILPEEVRWRRDKADLGYGLHAGLRSGDGPLIEDVVAHPGAVAEWVDPACLADLYRRCLTEGKRGDWYALWRVVVLALWLREHSFGAPNTR